MIILIRMAKRTKTRKTKRKPGKRVKKRKKVRKRTRKKTEKYCGKTEEEWRKWGEQFGKRMEREGEQFGGEMEDWGKKFGKRMERRGKRMERRWKNWWYRTFGPVWPLISSAFGIVFVVIGIFALNLVNLPLGSSFIAAISDFLFRNLQWFFAAFVFFGYTDYFSQRYPRTGRIISPITNSLGLVIAAWIASKVLDLINTSLGSSLIASISRFLSENLVGIFVFFLVLGYAFVLIKRFISDVLGLWD